MKKKFLVLTADAFAVLLGTVDTNHRNFVGFFFKLNYDKVPFPHA